MFERVFVAGTFDNLHAGHDKLLTRAFEEGKMVTIGLTSDIFVSTYKSQNILPFQLRRQNLIEWLADKKLVTRSTVISIDHPHEPLASDPTMDAVVVTPDNSIRGEEINTKRMARGLKKLTLLIVHSIPAEDFKPISSTRVRNGEIDPTGKLTLPDSLRPELVRPLGEVLLGDAIGSSIEKYRDGIIISVGDITTKTLLTAGVIPNLIIIDFLVGRKPFIELDRKLSDLNLYRIKVTSGPGYISQEAVSDIKKWSMNNKEKTVLVVSGEEDLLALPAIAYGPEDAIVYYGQPKEAAWACGPLMHEGMVEVVITPEKKSEAIALLSRFK